MQSVTVLRTHPIMWATLMTQPNFLLYKNKGCISEPRVANLWSILTHLGAVIHLCCACRRGHQCDDIAVDGFVRWGCKGVANDPQNVRKALLHLLWSLWRALHLCTRQWRKINRCDIKATAMVLVNRTRLVHVWPSSCNSVNMADMRVVKYHPNQTLILSPKYLQPVCFWRRWQWRR